MPKEKFAKFPDNKNISSLLSDIKITFSCSENYSGMIDIEHPSGQTETHYFIDDLYDGNSISPIKLAKK